MDVDAAIEQGTYVSLDAANVLSTFMVNGWPDRARFFEGFGQLIESASKPAEARNPRVAFLVRASLCCVIKATSKRRFAWNNLAIISRINTTSTFCVPIL